MADHGFTTLEQEVDLNAWLRAMGLLRLSRQPGSEWDATSIGPATRAFALDPGRIYLHTRERFGCGQLSLSEAEHLTDELTPALSALSWRGRKVLRHIHRGRDLYHGACAHLAPDLILVPEPGFDLKGKFDRPGIFGHFGRQGMHTVDDVFFFDSDGFVPRTPTDVGREILTYFGISASTITA
jgi:predicted AlkP superfamily phosphohydrolase/phosphomutase